MSAHTPSRCAERRVSRRGRARFNAAIWVDIVALWNAAPDILQKGVGQSTVYQHIKNLTGRAWPSHHIRQMLNYAVNAGHARIIPSVDSGHPTRFEITNRSCPAAPGTPLIVSNIMEENDRTWWENMEKTHTIPLETLVEIDLDYCPKHGARAFVVEHSRDCDGEPLYSLAMNKNWAECNKELLAHHRYGSLARMELSTGFTASCLRIIQDNEWPRVPPDGSYVVSSHPITALNPYKVFRVKEIQSDGGRIAARGEHTCWFSVKMLRPATPDELADLSNIHPDER